jgi:hypothetical protein
VRCVVEIERQPTESIFLANVAFVDSSGRLLAHLEGMECPSSKALNRLAAGSEPVLR